MQAEIQYRPLIAADYAAVVALWMRCDGVEVAEGDDQPGFLAYLARNPGLSRVATHGAGIVGAVLCGHDGRRGIIYHLAVAEEHRGHGIARQLVADCIAGLRTAGISRALILVARDNASGRDFWLASGFEPIAGAEPMGIDIA